MRNPIKERFCSRKCENFEIAKFLVLYSYLALNLPVWLLDPWKCMNWGVRTMPYQYLTLSPKLIKSYNIFHFFLQAVFQLLKFPGAQLPSCSNSRGAQLLVAQFHEAFRRCKYLSPVQILLQHCWYPQESHKNTFGRQILQLHTVWLLVHNM